MTRAEADVVDGERVDPESTTAALLFAGLGEMRARCRAFDWAATPLGPVERWSHGLRTAARLMLASRHPMFLWWGPELVQLYNDAYRPSLGDAVGDGGRHPRALGARGRAFWTDIWETIGPEIAQVMSTGEATWHEDAYVPIERNGRRDDVWWTYGYSPAYDDDDGSVGGTLVVCQETTARVLAERERERLRADTERAEHRAARVLAEVNDALVQMDREFRIVDVNPAAERTLGTPRDHLVGRSHWEAFPGSVGAEPERQYRRVQAERVEAHFTHRYVDSERDFVAEVGAYPTDDGGVAVFWRDVTARVEAEAKLRASEARYRTLFDAIDEGFCVIEVLFDERGDAVDYRFLEANPAFVEQTGLPDAIGRTMRELVPGHETEWFRIYGRVATTGVPTRFDAPAEALGRWYEVYAFRIGDPADRQVAVLFKDMKAIKLAERERERLLKEVESERARLAEIVRIAPAFMAVLRGPDHVIALTNAGFDALVGHRDVCGQTVAAALPEAAAQGFVALLDRVLATGEPFVGREVPYRRPDANGAEDVRSVDSVYQALVEADGTRSGVFVHGVDVTDQVRARGEVERLLAVSEEARSAAERARADADAARAGAEAERLRTVALQGVTAALAEARTLDDVAAVVVGPMAEAAGARAGSLAVPTAAGDALWQVAVFGFPEAVRPAIRVQPFGMASPIPESYRTGLPIWAERRDGPDGMDARYPAAAAAWTAAEIASGAYLPLAVAGGTAGVIAYAFAEPHAFAEAERAFLLALARQVAVAVERARLWEAERAARAEAERANRAKSEFLAVMSHELRTPLNAIGGYAELIELGIHGPVTDAQRMALERIQVSQRHLLGLIAGVLDYSRVEAGAVTYRVVDVPVIEAVAEAEVLVAPQLRARGLGYAWAGAPPGLAVRADREKLQQILLNLLGNAVKFTDARDGAPGRIEVSCTVDSAADPGDGAAGLGRQAARVRIHVRDTGAGIAADALERVFEPFVQADQRLTRPHSGVGLGLAISRDLARGMGGDLTAESTPGVGSTFTLTLPAAL